MSNHDSSSRISFSLREKCVLLSLLLIAVYLRFTGISTREIWIDEGLTYAQLGGNVVPGIPPFYFWMLDSLSHVLGTDIGALRIPSAMADLLTGILLVATAARYHGPRCTLLIAALYAVSPYQIYYAQEARYYALMNAFLLCAVICYFIPGWCSFGVAALSSLAAFLTNYLALVPLSAVIIPSMLIGIRKGNRPLVFRSLLILLLLGISGLAIRHTTGQSHLNQLYGTSSLSELHLNLINPLVMMRLLMERMAYLLYAYLAGFIHALTFMDTSLPPGLRTVLKLLPVGGAIGILAYLAAEMMPGRRLERLPSGAILVSGLVAASGALVIFVLEFAFGYYRFQSRHTSFIVPALIFLLGVGLDRILIKRRWLGVAAGMLLLSYEVAGVWTYHGTDLKSGFERWSVVVEEIRRSGSNEPLLVSGVFSPPLIYAMNAAGMKNDVIEYPATWREIAAGTLRSRPDDLERRLELLRGKSEVWLIDARTSLAEENLDERLGNLGMIRAETRTFESGVGSDYAVPTVLTRYRVRDARESIADIPSTMP